MKLSKKHRRRTKPTISRDLPVFSKLLKLPENIFAAIAAVYSIAAAGAALIIGSMYVTT